MSTLTTPTPVVSGSRLNRTYLRLDVRRTLRNRRTVIFTMVMPVVFFLVFGLGQSAAADRAYVMISLAVGYLIASGLRVVDPALATESLASGSTPLTDRETDVLRAARAGGTVADLALALHLSEGTVGSHLSAAIGKTRAEAVRLAEGNGWLL